VKALAYSLAIDVHPVCNMSVATHASGGQEPARVAWMHHFIPKGLAAFEALLAGFPEGAYACGEYAGAGRSVPDAATV
jgi:maleylacetoacetate isomerase